MYISGELHYYGWTMQSEIFFTILTKTSLQLWTSEVGDKCSRQLEDFKSFPKWGRMDKVEGSFKISEANMKFYTVFEFVDFLFNFVV